MIVGVKRGSGKDFLKNFKWIKLWRFLKCKGKEVGCMCMLIYVCVCNYQFWSRTTGNYLEYSYVSQSFAHMPEFCKMWTNIQDAHDSHLLLLIYKIFTHRLYACLLCSKYYGHCDEWGTTQPLFTLILISVLSFVKKRSNNTNL